MVGTIGIGLLEIFFKAGDLWVWNVDGDRFWFSLYTGVIVGVCKRAISRCLVVMLDSVGANKLEGTLFAGLGWARVCAFRPEGQLDFLVVLSFTIATLCVVW